jgi:hypothetical protein
VCFFEVQEVKDRGMIRMYCFASCNQDMLMMIGTMLGIYCKYQSHCKHSEPLLDLLGLSLHSKEKEFVINITIYNYGFSFKIKQLSANDS